ncbi:MAG: 23S rRNA (uracil(1939)-C(5))-methyltransferase RlmD [Syntrophorhabdaceae bacterium]|nr:23S rRNA (uracil(1939)-C(5))-methyltransferase RlmD [Syntrophorhabdaceae bacterium]MDD4196673.1 23S rRNA (uracil(1939)-C(5))-methyltransferase RlmD [Syntrophorhabdaceae bacterium]HOC46774.1 23S rRNA (uracil(1939)-C(5))-methyltransferase RlmD [Syntrophorhabdaceae bacterium]
MNPSSNMDHTIVTVTDIAMPGDTGVAKIDNFVVFIPGAVPGDRVAVRIIKREKRFGYAELIAIEEASPHRIHPPCPHFDRCGGCTIQSIQYTKQLEIKETYLRQCLKRIGKLDMPDSIFDPITPSPDIFWYRSKIELSFGNDGNGRIIAGMREKSSPAAFDASSVIPVPECAIFSRAQKKVVEVVEDYVHSEGLFPYDGQKKSGILRHLVLRESKVSGRLMVIAETKDEVPPSISELYYRLKREVPGVTSLYRTVNNRPGSYIDYSDTRHEGGELYIEESLASLKFRVYPASFFQPNPAGASFLYEKIGTLTSAERYRNVLGLYCGMAPIELVVSRNAHHVAGIDHSKENIDNARENALINGIENCTFTAGKVEDIVLGRGFKRPDLVVVDPPRSGISPKGIDIITRLGAASLIYVSCNPATLARDLNRLASRRYSPERIAPFDLFPHTSHLETLVMLKAAKRGRSLDREP